MANTTPQTLRSAETPVGETAEIVRTSLFEVQLDGLLISSHKTLREAELAFDRLVELFNRD